MRDPLQPAETVKEGGGGAYEVGTLGCCITGDRVDRAIGAVLVDGIMPVLFRFLRSSARANFV